MNTLYHSTIGHPRIIFLLGFFVFAIGIGCWLITSGRLSIEIALLSPLVIILLGGWRKWYIVILMLIVSLCGWYLGRSEFDMRQDRWGKINTITSGFSGSYDIVGTVEHLMYTSDLRSNYRLKIDNIANRSTKEIYEIGQYDIGLFVEVPNNLHISVWDTIGYRGKILPIIERPIRGFAGYAWYHRIYGKSIVPVFERKQIHQYNILESVQHWAKWVLFRGFPENIAGIILGMTIGNIELLSSETKQYFTNAGITHILVVSGSNIAFVIVLLTGILRYVALSRWVRSCIIIVFVLLYGSLVGWDMPVVRAVAMWLITYMAMEGGKRASSVSILFLVGWIILIYSPLALVYDSGFGLSFSGTLGILLFHKRIGSLLSRRYLPRWVVDIVSVTLSASIGSMIAIIYHFGVIPLLTLISNMLISGVLGWILFASIAYLGISYLGAYALYIWGWLIYVPTAYIMWVGKFFGNGYTYTIPTVLAEPISILLMGCMIVIVLSLEYRNLLDTE